MRPQTDSRYRRARPSRHRSDERRRELLRHRAFLHFRWACLGNPRRFNTEVLSEDAEAAEKSSDVSRAKPKEPAISRASTSSLVLPAIANSRSWIAAAPLSASPCKTPPFTQSIKYGAQPVLITWPPTAAVQP